MKPPTRINCEGSLGKSLLKISGEPAIGDYEGDRIGTGFRAQEQLSVASRSLTALGISLGGSDDHPIAQERRAGDPDGRGQNGSSCRQSKAITG